MPIKHVLMVDDDPDDIFLMEKVLKELSPSLRFSYLEACEELPAFLLVDAPDLILMDINMPRQNGFQCLRSLKSSEWGSIPVVMYSSSDHSAQIAMAYDCGAALYFRKPNTYNQMLAGLEELIGYDWSDPAAITHRHLFRGKYLPFFSSPDRH